jgi:hypothetical protein
MRFLVRAQDTRHPVPDHERLGRVNSMRRESGNLDLAAAAVVIASRQGRIEYWSPRR